MTLVLGSDRDQNKANTALLDIHPLFGLSLGLIEGMVTLPFVNRPCLQALLNFVS